MSTILVTIYTPQELNHSSYVQTGLFELEQKGFLKVKVKLSYAKRLGILKTDNENLELTNQPHSKTSFYELEELETGKKIKFATDLYDASFSFSKFALDNCDYVFKRNFETKQIEKLPLEYQKKIIPLGLTFGCQSKYKKCTKLFYIGFLLSNLRLNFKLDYYFFGRLKKSFNYISNHWSFVKTSRNIKDFESLSNENKTDTILFQTRCFHNEEQKDVYQIHQQRKRIILLLKDNFKDKFKGGFIPSQIAKKKYGNELTNLSTDPDSYLKLVKDAKIMIYTRGLVNSPAWKMPEYLSQGKVIVAEKLTAELPAPLRDGEEVLFFDNELELINKINGALQDEQLCERLCTKAREYFERNVHPVENIKRIVTFMLNQELECKK